MKTKILLFILIIINITALSGCWNYRETEDISIVAGLAIDKGNAGEYILTFEIADLHEAGKDVKIKSKLLESTGTTIFDAVRNAIRFVAPRLYFGHLEIVIISQEVARDGVIEIIDFLSRDAEPRLTVELLVSKGKKANEILHAEAIESEINSYEIKRILDEGKQVSKSSKVEVFRFINSLPCEGVCPILPVIFMSETAGEKTSKVSGIAVFHGDKLSGFLTQDESLYFNFVVDDIEGGLLTLKSKPEEQNNDVTLEIYKNKTKVKPLCVDGKITMDINVKLQVLLAELGTTADLINETGRSWLEKAAEEKVRVNILKIIQKVQKEYGADIFGFGRVIQNVMPSTWKQIGKDWDNSFRNLDVNVNVSVEIKDSGLLRKPIVVGK